MIIQCPQCNTKFSINGDALAAVSNPRFHCSRCNHYFHLHEKKSSDKSFSDKKLGSFFSKKTPPAPDSNKQLNWLSKSEAAPGQDSDVSDDFMADEWTIDEKENLDLTEVSHPPRFDIDEPSIDAPGDLSFERVPTNSYTIEESDDAFIIPGREETLPKEKRKFKIPTPRFSIKSLTGNAGVALFCSVPLAACVAVSLWSNNLEQTPTAIQEILDLSGSNLSQPAVSGLELTNLKGEYISLADNTGAIKISGDLVNATLDTFQNVRIEALLYDKANNKLSRAVFPLKNKLEQNQIGNVGLEAAMNLQAEEQKNQKPIGPNEKTTFALVLPEPQLSISESVAWFSSRVYSVRSLKTKYAPTKQFSYLPSYMLASNS